jgi:multidrug efflux pump
MTLILMIVGMVSYTYLTVRHYPQVDRPVISVMTSYEGASPQIVETLITKPLEAALAGIEGLDYMTSSSESENSSINLYFRPNRSLDDAASDVRDKVSRVNSRLPEGAKTPMIKKAEAESDPVVYLALYSKEGNINNAQLYDLADKQIKNELEAIGGVAGVDIFGGNNFVMHVWIDPVKMSSFNVTAAEVSHALKQQNVHIPAGRLVGDDREFHVTTPATLKTVEAFNDVVVGLHKGYLVRLKDIGYAEFSSAEERSLSRFNDKPAVAIGVIKKSVANPVEISRELHERLPDIRKLLPKGLEIEIAFDKSIFIEESIKQVYHTLIEATVCVLVIILLFLWSFRAAVIPLVTIPVSLISTFTLLYICGFSINILTLLAIVLAIGLVVDDAIVMMENIHRYIELGMKPFQAAIKGSKEISFAIIAMTLTLAAVYAPIALSSGQIGKLFTEFALTLAGSVIISGFIALTLSPMMCSRMLKPHKGEPNTFDRYYEKFAHGYGTSLGWALRHRMVVIVIGGFFALSGLFVAMYGLDSEVAPREDQGVIYSFADSSQGATLPYIQYYMDQAEQIFREVPEVEKRLAIIQAPMSRAWNVLTPWDQRKRSSIDITESIRQKLRDITGLNARATPGRSLVGGGGNTDTVKFVMQTTKSYNELYTAAALLERALMKTGVMGSLFADLGADTQEFVIDIDRDKAGALGVDVKAIGETLDTFISGRRVTDYKREHEQFDVQVSVTPDQRRAPDDLSSIYVKGQKDVMIPLSSLVTIKKDPIPVEIQHFNQLRSVTISGDLAPGRSLSEAVKILKDLSDKVLPENVRTDFSGDTKELIETEYTMYLIFGLALAFIYLVMAAQFESFTDPFIIMLTVPLSLAGAVLALKISHGTFNVYSQIGLVTLIGLITKHGILIVDFANAIQKKNTDMIEAVKQATFLRLRPILMTTFAMVLGAVPLVWATGAGAEGRRQIGWVILGGMVLGTIFTLFVIPVMYSLLARKKQDHEDSEELESTSPKLLEA